MTNEKLIAARDAYKAYTKLLPKTVAELRLRDHHDTILSLLDSHINPPDLSELKREIAEKFNEWNSHVIPSNLVSDIIDHLAPRIVREGQTQISIDELSNLRMENINQFARIVELEAAQKKED